jgi:hypothetical protein
MKALTDKERIGRIKKGGIVVEDTDIDIGAEVIIADTLEKGVVTELNFLRVSGACSVKITVGKCSGCSRIRFIDELEKI